MKWKSGFGASLIPLNILLLFFLIFVDKIAVPSWLQVFGRMHPMALHFPIVLVVLYAIWVLFTLRATRADAEVADILLLAAAFTAVLTALMGLLLSKEPGYEGTGLAWHKWMGAAAAFGLFVLWQFRDAGQRTDGSGRLNALQRGDGSGGRPLISGLSALGILLVTVLAGHLGGNITHGENFVLGPVTPEKTRQTVALEEARIYNDLVGPILETKCLGCHNSNKAKGGLVMDSREGLQKGGRDGKLWDTTEAGLGLMMSRIHLPLEEKKHMPPASRPQLTDDESAVLYHWIKGGSFFEKKIADLPQTDSLRLLAASILKPSDEEKYDFAAADEKKVQALNTNYRAVSPLAKGSPALAVDFYGAAFFRSEQLKELDVVKTQIVELNLDKMPVDDKGLAIIAGFTNLRVLNLSFSKITGAGIHDLLRLSKLKSLSLSGTAVKAEDIRRLAALKDLHSLYVWNTGISSGEVAAIVHDNTGLAISTGFRADTVHIRLNAPILENEERIVLTPLTVSLRHYVPGAVIRYTLDGTEPDSIASPAYTAPFILSSRAALKAKAFKTGWSGSEVTKADFYSEKYRPDSVQMLQPVDSNYMKLKSGILIDLQKGDLNYGNGKWLGFHKNKMECLLFFNKPVKAGDVTVSAVVDINNDVMPPVSVEVWGGSDKGNLKLLGRIDPEQPEKSQAGYLTGYLIKFKPVSVRVLKVVSVPVDKLPDWHTRKGKRGWVMTDEIFVN
ncbi:MAG TPA: chitobiase/beta-hexosaminidase C-terminal domain-containing protein [Puia sp.]|nr:chitobiase/beta-hexosaminidase C-terminal domain-containing protein [Puia sp.]